MAALPDAAKLAISIGASQLAGVIGSLFTARTVSSWYLTLRKPSWTPPGAVFGPVWISLYLLMGIAAFLVWKKGLGHAGVKTALVLFIVQLVLNALWSAAFFGVPSPLAGFVVIICLWVAIFVTIMAFLRISTGAGVLLVPYILWVSFAGVLNWSILVLNRS
jgi:tryptophan-rich sensory protein